MPPLTLIVGIKIMDKRKAINKKNNNLNDAMLVFRLKNIGKLNNETKIAILAPAQSTFKKMKFKSGNIGFKITIIKKYTFLEQNL